MATLEALDREIGGVASNASVLFGGIAVSSDEHVRCSRCGYGGCDVRVSGCGCTLHGRCVALPSGTPLSACPACSMPCSGLSLFQMSFREIDEARKLAEALPSAKGRGRKRKSPPTEVAELESRSIYISERRTGRWTLQEMALCDKLIEKFESGELPLCDGVKLNEFLGNMLKSKQSRLTKKMKNAKLSARTFQHSSGGLLDLKDAREFSELEESFFQSIQDPQERAEIKFHMKREWREQFSQFCLAVGQPLDADGWLTSVEEMDRRAAQAKDAARMAKRKLMMGFALRRDCKNLSAGVFIEKTESDKRITEGAFAIDDNDVAEQREILKILAEEAQASCPEINGKSSLLHSAPFLAKTSAYIRRHQVPFEHVDLWVPSFVPGADPNGAASSCRLCFAGSETIDDVVAGESKTKPLTPEEQFNLNAFGDYSQKFSFEVGCGLPGRVYESGRPTWEQSVQNAPQNHFERCGGAIQWGVKTVLAIPIASPNVGRVVVILYSMHDREKDQDLVARLSEEFTRLMPSPKWKLVVDVGDEEPATTESADPSLGSTEQIQDTVDLSGTASVASKATAGARDGRVDEIVALLGEVMPSDVNSPLAPYLSGFMSLRLLLLRPSWKPEEEEMARTMLDSYTSYSEGGRERFDIAVMLARDYMFLCQQKNQPSQQSFSFGQGNVTNNGQGSALPEYSVFEINSPTLAPIATGDSMSIVSS